MSTWVAVSFTVLALGVGACAATSSQVAPPAADPRPALPAAANAHGRYEGLLATLEVPGDIATYGAFNDWGFWQGTSYAGRDDLPPGYWVYASPNWYVWAKDTRPEPVLIYGRSTRPARSVRVLQTVELPGSNR